MALEYILYLDSDMTPQGVKAICVNKAYYQEDEDFYHFKCMSAAGIQAQSEFISESIKPDLTVTGEYNGVSWDVKPTIKVFFTLAKDDSYNAGKVNLAKAIMCILENAAGDAAFFNNDNHDSPLLIRYKNKLVLSDNPLDGFWDPQYEPEVLSLVSIEYEFGQPERIL
jgi:hypothetical protein